MSFSYLIVVILPNKINCQVRKYKNAPNLLKFITVYISLTKNYSTEVNLGVRLQSFEAEDCLMKAARTNKLKVTSELEVRNTAELWTPPSQVERDEQV